MQKIVRQFLTFAGVGAIGTAAQYAILIALVERGGRDAAFSSACGFGVGAVLNYLGNYHWTFASRRAHRQAAPRFAVIAVLGALLNTVVMYSATRLLGIYYLYGQLGATALVLLFNFAANRRFTFSLPPRQAAHGTGRDRRVSRTHVR